MVITQRSERIHVLVGVCSVATAAALGFSLSRWLVLILIIGIVQVAEACNTAIEYTVDLASPDIHPLARRAKDAAAGAVLLAAALGIGIGLTLFTIRIMELLEVA